MLTQHWPLPQNVGIAMTGRHGGVSLPPYDSLNLGLHVGDREADVLANRALLKHNLGLNFEPQWLQQVHGTRLVDLGASSMRTADASYSNRAENICVVMTADCLPILLCDTSGTEVAAVHAGWRGLCDGVIEAAIAAFKAPAANLQAYLGPAIGPQAFEVGTEVREQFVVKHAQAETFFVPHADKYLADLLGLASLRLQLAGVERIYAANVCTFQRATEYFSYRRDRFCGRMASLIWLKS
ncbi:peptidoglycan editing factor PgeF [Shewanella sp. AS16]|uniref:peptidoglycan editing factor PgeF n=1 Tax=Shewanella sp. AS16 TaxID=2907625 RepID=UPI001F3F4009|nr:peptidoglycan editing factor PgeF [Shewanella sp. AS16]MCE9685555.1 peptidoglycan editing factor PgeF [Shewanella sp. AS16]